MIQRPEWEGFKGNLWRGEINVRDFIQHNYTSYKGNKSFLEGPTQATDTLWTELRSCRKKSVQKAAFLIWIPMSCHRLHLTVLDISVQKGKNLRK